MLFQFRLVVLYEICCFHFHCVMDVWLETVVYVFNGSKVLIFSDVVFRILFELGEQAQLKKCRALEVNAACEGSVGWQ